MKKYLYVYVKFFDIENTFDARYLATEDIYKKGDYVWVNFEGEETSAIVIKSKWFDENKVPYPLDKMKYIIRTSTKEEYMKCNENSVINYILSNMNKKSELPDNFTLNKYRKFIGTPFIDGARDGINFFVENQKTEERILNFLKNIVIHPRSNYLQVVEEIDNELIDIFSMLNYTDDLYSYLASLSKEEIDFNYLFNLAETIIFHTKSANSMSLGIVLFSIFDINKVDEYYLEYFKQLVLCEEYTLYIEFYIFKQLPNYNELVFEVAKQKRGWGRIFSILLLTNDSKEIQEWLLNEGYNNNIDIHYVAKLILDKIDIPNIILKEKITDKQLNTILTLINNTMLSGKSKDFKDLKQSKLIEEALVKKYKNYNDNILYLNTIKNIYLYNNKKNKKIIKILNNKQTFITIKNTFITKNPEELLKLIDICNITPKRNYTEEALEVFKCNPIIYSFCIGYLYNNTKTRDELVDILKKAEILNNKLSKKEETEFRYLLDELEFVPNTGVKFVDYALKSKNKYLKDKAIFIVNRWHEQCGLTPKTWKEYLDK